MNKTLSDESGGALCDGLSVAREVRVMEAYRRHEADHPFVRELECLKVQTPASLLEIREGDWFAGRQDRLLVGIDQEHGGLDECAFYCAREDLQRRLVDPRASDEVRTQIRELLAFWEGRTTYDHCRRAFPEHLQKGLPADDYYTGTEISYPMFGLGGPMLDFGKLLRLGIGGLREQVEQRRRRAQDEEQRRFLDSLSGAIDIFVDAALRYAADARAKASQVADEESRQRLLLIEASCRHIASEPPRTYHQTVQLVLLYCLVSLVKNYGRMDVYLGDFLARDLEAGVISMDQAREMTLGLWKLIHFRGNHFNNRMVLGGRGRPNPQNADRFIKLALEVQAIYGQAIPQMALRWYEGMDKSIWDQALATLAGGSTQPMLYNDDVNVPAVERAFGVSEADAEQYVMYGCGEYVIDYRSIGSPDAALNIAKALTVTLFNGTDPFVPQKGGRGFGELRSLATFEAFREAYAGQLRHEIALLAEAQALIYRETSKHACYPFLSLLYADCVERGKPLLAGGVRHVGGTLEAFGSSTASDSLLAIKKTVYDEGIVTPEELLEALRADFVGHEALRRQLLGYPKYGNDDLEADAMSLWLNGVICKAARQEGKRVGLDSFLIVLINNGDSIWLGKGVAATPDGRKAGQPIANGNQPGAGYDQSGLTALLNSMSKLDAGLHAGVVHNVKLSRGLAQSRRAEVSALFRAYFASGGTQAMITVTDRGELERAMEEPEKYANLIVRVGGYSERFVNLPREIQQEIIRRTLYS